MNAGCPEGEDLRSVIEQSLRVARKLGNVEAENQLMMALLSLGPRDNAGADPADEELRQSVEAIVRALGGRPG